MRPRQGGGISCQMIDTPGGRQDGKSKAMSVSTEQKRKEGGFAETVRVVIHALLIAFVIRTFLFQPFNIPSGSMRDTLLIGHYVSVAKSSTGSSHSSFPSSPTLFSGRIFGREPPGEQVR